ncbi:MAG: DUF2232 domain-containing protein [Bradyrhizobium sp.]|uniref:DUF2232 domain-containing protein n=1 Tax=Bradyrhizobium sp. TaxID=376 RepID=UPI00272508B6|nr:DUF2232 domain-containing protein [Bradyrhizobium sp.]MDO8400838.1 DUF2232 domain-containing protein [Bradyrhizobium sp.]
MTMIVLIAIAAGCASALMFASIISGALISIVLLYFTALPLMVAGLGWGPLAATIGGIGAATGLGVIFGLHISIPFVVMMALPAWWLGHLALLGRPVASAGSSEGATPSAPPVMEWYPVGRILLWIAGFGTLSTMATLLTLGTDGATITETLRAALLRVLGPRVEASGDEIKQRIDVALIILPAAFATSAMTMLMLNFWLAARITAMSGRLRRSWPDLKSTELPPMTLAALSAAFAFCFSGGLLAMLGQTVTAALLMVYAVIGFAVLHTLTLGLKGRGLWLACSYTMVVVSGGWLILAMAALGIADALFKFRQRFLHGRPPPLPAS